MLFLYRSHFIYLLDDRAWMEKGTLRQFSDVEMMDTSRVTEQINSNNVDGIVGKGRA